MEPSGSAARDAVGAASTTSAIATRGGARQIPPVTSVFGCLRVTLTDSGLDRKRRETRDATAWRDKAAEKPTPVVDRIYRLSEVQEAMRSRPAYEISDSRVIS